MFSPGIVAASHVVPAAGGVLLSDNFDRANSTSLGADWTEVAGDWTIASNQLLPANSGQSLLRHTTDLNTDDHYCQITVVSLASTTNNYPAVLVRYSTSADTFYMGRFARPTNTWEIARRVAGTFTTIASTAGTLTPPYTIRLEVAGSDLRLYEGATLRLSTTDANITGNLRVGLRDNGAGGASDVLDDFEAGDL